MMNREGILAEIAAEVCVCVKCPLSATRTQAVPGEGSAQARVMFIGEGPGAQEDLTGRPFVGKAGQLLNRLLKDIGLQREEVFIANVVKCRPPDNRVPSDNEALSCNDWLMSQIAVVQPEIIGLLGGTALKWVLDANLRITRVHGHLYHKDGILWMPFHHPAGALRRDEWLVQLEQDFLKLRDLLSRPIREDEIIDLGPKLTTANVVRSEPPSERNLSLF